MVGVLLFVVVIAVIAVVGHGIWIAVAAVVRKVFNLLGSSSVGAAPCLVCGSARGVVGTRCRTCGAPATLSDRQRHLVDVHATRRQLERWLERGRIQPDEYQSLLRLLQQEEQTLTGWRAAASLAPESPLVAGPFTPAPLPDATAESGSGPILPPPLPVAPRAVSTLVPSGSGVGAGPPPLPAHEGPFAAERAEPRPALRRSLAEVLQAFMQEKNIRWAEVVSGILIVVSAVGLVISLRATLKDMIPYFPALSFLLVTAAIHGAGLYSLRRWRLKNTSRGVLIIATLLVPLSFLASIILSGPDEQQRPVGDPLFLLAVLIGFVSFGTMNYFATRALLAHGWWRLMVAVLGTSAGQLIVNRLQPSDLSPISANGLLAVPLVAFLVPLGVLQWTVARRRSPGRRSAGQFYLEVGISTFAFLVPVGLLLSKASASAEALGNLAPGLSLAAAAILGSGLLAQRVLVRPSLVAFRTAGTAIAVFGGGLMLFLVAVAWPRLGVLLAVGIVNFAILTTFAYAAGLPLLHLLALGSLGLAYLSGFHWWRDGGVGGASSPSAQIVQATFSGDSGLALSIFTTVVAAAGWALLRNGRRSDGELYLTGALAFSLLCVAIAAYAGFVASPEAHPDLATPIFFYFSGMALVAGWFADRLKLGRFLSPFSRSHASADWDRSIRRAVTTAGSLLLLTALLHALWRNQWIDDRLMVYGVNLSRPVLLSFVAHGVLAGMIAAWSAVWARLIGAGTADARPHDRQAAIRGFAAPLAASAAATSCAAAPFALLVAERQFAWHAGYLLCLSVAWLCMSVVGRPAIPFAIFQALASVSLSYATAAVCARQSWWNDNLLASTHLHVQVAVLAAWCGAWSTARRMLRDRPVVAVVWPAGFAVDKGLLHLIAGFAVVLAAAGCVPGILVELGISEADVAGLKSAVFHGQWARWSSWWAIGLTLASFALSLWDRLSLGTLDGAIVASAAIPLLASGWWENELAVGSALRWWFAAYVVAWGLPAWYWGGRGRGASQWIAGPPPLDLPCHTVRVVSLLLGASTILVLTTAALWCVSAGYSPAGPVATSVFGRIGFPLSYAGPLAVLVAVLFAYAVRESRPAYALASSIVFQYGLSLVCLIPDLKSGTFLDGPARAKLLQWNALGLALFACAWLAGRRWIEQPPVAPLFPLTTFRLLHGQLAMVFAAQLLVGVSLAVMFTINPAASWPASDVLGRWPSYAALVLALSLALWLLRRGPPELRTHCILFLSLVAVHVVAASVHSYDRLGQWWGYRVISAGSVALAAIATGWSFWRAAGRREAQSAELGISGDAAVFWVTVTCALAVLAGMRGTYDDPLRPWWPAGVSLAGALVTGTLGVRCRQQPFAYVSTAIGLVAAMLFWLGLPPAHPLGRSVGLIALSLATGCAAACAWLAVEVAFQKRGHVGMAPLSRLPPIHRVIAAVATAGSAAYFLLATSAILLGETPLPMQHAELWAAAAALALMFTLFGGLAWDRGAWNSLLSLYVGCLCVVAFVVERQVLAQSIRTVVFMVAVSFQVALSGWLWSWGSKLAVIAYKMGVPDPVEGLRRAVRWLPGANVTLAAALGLASLLVVVTWESRNLRIICACMPFLLAGGLAGLAQQHRRDAMQIATLLVASLGVVLLSWADIDPGGSGDALLTRAIRLLLALCFLAFFLSVVATRILSPQNSWLQAARRAAVVHGAGAFVALLGVLSLEVVHFQPGVGAPIDTGQLLVVSLVLVSLIVALLALAVMPGQDPFALSERGRMVYVYAAQAVAGLLFAHLYLARPTVFNTQLRPWWPYILLAIAFAGVGVAELFQRLGWRVLAEPFQRSGAFMPLVPALGMWVIHSESDYSVVLFAIGVLYMLVSFSQKSLLARVAAVVAANGSLWSLLSGTEDLTFSKHPQFWLIPPALSGLVAAQLNRHRLTTEQLVAMRYLCLGVIYLSSSVEMLQIGIGESLWPPMVLTTLAIAGVFFGIAMQVRAYLYMGSLFVLIGMVSMVAHASRSIQHVWPWWAFGIVMGLMILVIFGWFESRRAQILALVDRLQKWEQ